MKTGAKCFDIYRPPLVSAPFREWFRGGGRGKKRKRRKRRAVVIFSGERPTTTGTTVGTHTSEPVRFNFSRALGLIVKNIGPGWESGKIVQGPSTGSWPKKGSNLLEFTTLSLLAENYVTGRGLVGGRLIEAAIASPASHSFARRGKNTGTRRCRGSPNGNS